MTWLACILSNIVLASLLALAAWFVQRRLKRPAVARVLWLFALVKLVTPPLVSVPIGDAAGTMACTLGVCGCSAHAGTQALVRDTLPWVLLAAWSAGAVATGWIAWRRWARFRKLLAHARPAPPDWQALAERLAAELFLKCPPEILAVPGRLPPLVVPGRPRPRILLPFDLMDRLNPSQREALLLHELVHLQRGDHLVRMLELAVSVIYWWLPIVGSIGRQLRSCEEQYCDAAVTARLPQARRDYARLLLDVLDFADPVPGPAIPQATAMSAADDLEQRLRSILDDAQGVRRSWPAGAFAMGLACVIVPCELHVGLTPRHAPAVSSEDCEPAVEQAPSPGDNRQGERMATLCCPS